jgi:hypothetical protein
MRCDLKKSMALGGVLALAAGCGGGSLEGQAAATNKPGGTITVVASLGAPIAGAQVTIEALDSRGQVATAYGTNGLLGQCGSTDAGGTLSCNLSVQSYAGPVRIHLKAPSTVTDGGLPPGLRYIDPSDGLTVMAIPQSFELTSILASYKTGTQVTVPVTGWTTLADAAVLAYVAGVNRAAPTPHTLQDAIAAIDPLFQAHVTSAAWSLRGTPAVSLTTTSQSLRDAVFAALPDVGLNQLARDRSALAHVSPGGVISAVTLLALLAQDVQADGQFDGLGQGGLQLKTDGNPTQSLDASWLRFLSARAIDAWFASTLNKTGLTSSDLQYANVFNAFSTDASILFPSSSPPAPYDNTPPNVSLVASFTNGGRTAAPVGTSSLVAGALTLTVDATDPSGVASLAVQTNDGTGWKTVSPGPSSTTAHLVATIDSTTLANGTLSIRSIAADKVGNSGTTVLPSLTVDNVPPAITVNHPMGVNLAYSSTVPANINVTQANGVGSVAETSLKIPLVQNGASNWVGSWPIPAAQQDAALQLTFTACSLTFACRAVTVPFFVDRTPPALTLVTAPPRYTKLTTVSVVLKADDGPIGSGVSAVYVQNTTTQAAPVAGTYDATTGNWTVAGIPLKPSSDNTLVAYGVDRALDGADTPAGANTGLAHAAPYTLTLSSANDITPPTISTPLQDSSYFDERTMKLALGSGDPALASSWSYDPSATTNSAAVSKLQVDLGASQTTVHKTAQRIMLGTSTPNVHALLTTNATNTPYLRFTIDGTGSPVASASYQGTLSCTGCSFPTASGSLLLNTDDASGMSYLLPLSSEYISALGQLPSTATLKVFVSATDAAGNVSPYPTTPTATLTFALDAPPILAFREVGVGSDPWAAANMTLAGGTYLKQEAAATTSTPPEGERFVKWVVYNLGPQIGISLTLGKDASDTVHTAAVGDDYEQYNDEPLRAYTTASPYCQCSVQLCSGAAGSPYAWYSWYLTGGSHPRCTNAFANNPATNYPPQKMAGGGLNMQVYLTNDGVTPGAPAGVVGSNTLLPAASTSMGMLVVFVGRTASAISRNTYNIDWASGVPQLAWTAATSTFDTPYVDVPDNTSRYVGPVDPSCTTVSPAGADVQQATYCWSRTNSWQKKLASAQTNLYGTVTWTATASQPGTTAAAGSPTSANNVVFTRVVGH